jgi:hypothetical protein
MEALAAAAELAEAAQPPVLLGSEDGTPPGPVDPVAVAKARRNDNPSRASAIPWNPFTELCRRAGPRGRHQETQALGEELVGLLKAAPAADNIMVVCLELAAFLMEKNRDYGNSALEPVRYVSKADAAEQIRVRMDDKLSRLVRGNEGGEDVVKDLVGYWVLMRVAEKMKAQNGG